MKRRDLLRGPRLPLRQGMGGKPLGDSVLVKRGAHLCPRPLYLGFPPRAARVGDLVLPIDPWQQALPRPFEVITIYGILRFSSQEAHPWRIYSIPTYRSAPQSSWI